MTGFSVQPAALAVPASRYDAAAQVLAGAAHAVCSVVVPTGRAESSSEAVLTVQRLAVQLQGLSLDVERHSVALRAAAAGYTAADRRATGH